MLADVLIALATNDAKFLVVGGVAMNAHHYSRGTSDLDLLPALDTDNLEIIIATLESLGYAARLPVDPREMKSVGIRKQWLNEKNLIAFTFHIPSDPMRDIDLLINATVTFEECFPNAKILELSGQKIAFASLQDLLAMKRRTGREKDQYDIAVIERMLEAENEG